MPYDLTEVENELRSVGEEQYRVEEQMVAVQQQMSQEDSWLKTHDAATPGYQDRLEEWLSLEAYLAEEVEASQQARVLKRDNAPIAMLTPVKKKQSAKSQAVKAALALAGAWKDLPSDQMEEELDRIRHSSKPTPPLEL